MTELVQCFIDILAWFLVPFALIFAVTWATSFFRSR